MTPVRLLMLLGLFVLVFTVSGGAQSDRALVHLDKPLYVLGETAWFSVLLPAKDGLLDATLIAPDGRPIDRYRLRLRDHCAEGYQKFDYEWPAGRYRLLLGVYDRKRGRRLPLAEVPIPVYDDLAAPPETTAVPAPQAARPALEALSISIRGLPAGITTGATVQGSIEVTDATGRPVAAHLSVAVTDARLIRKEGPAYVLGEALPADWAPDTLLHLQGTVSDSSGRPFPTPFLGAFLSPREALTITAPDRAGAFDFALPRFYGSGKVQIEDYKGFSIRIRRPAEQILAPAAPLDYDDNVRRYLQWSRRRKKIYQLFQAVEMPVAFSPIDQDSVAYRPDRSLRLDDYAAMEDLPTFFREVATPLKFRRRNGRWVARMFNPEIRRFHPGHPLFIIDGQLTWDAELVARLDIRDIAGIELFFFTDALRHQFQAFGRYGVVLLRSRSGALTLPETQRQNVFPVAGLQRPAAFPVLPAPATDERPRFRPQLYWNPCIKTDARGRARFEFRQSDTRSTFRIDVVARSADGRSGMGEARYEVAW